MNNTLRNILLLVTVAIIVIAIRYLNFQKPKPLSGTAEDVTIANTNQDRNQVLEAKMKKYSKAKEFVSPSGFINTEAFKLSDLVGKKVVLVDFWTYSCINCQRTLPYLEAWDEKYRDQGLVIVGVHTPEFDFEKKYDNVIEQSKKLGVKYPIVMDNDYSTWNAYSNQYWPHEYLIDIDGFVVHDHIGEGGYDETERAIQEALKERKEVLGDNINVANDISNPKGVIAMDQSKVGSPETYFGSNRNDYLANGNLSQNSGIQNFVLPNNIIKNRLYLEGSWDIKPEFTESKSNASKIVYKYNSKNVYFVASSQNGTKIKILQDGVVIGSTRGKDVSSDGTVMVKENRLYELVHGDTYGEHTLEIQVEGSGLEAYTFTFG